MKRTANVSTHILRDSTKEIEYIATPNVKDIFDRIFVHNHGSNRSFNLIGNYGTGKSTFLWALEKNLNKEKIFFNSFGGREHIFGYDFLKIIGSNISFSKAIGNELKLSGEIDNAKIINSLELRRNKAEKKKKGFVILVDEFGKFLEYANKENTNDELYLLQQISEWANDDKNETYFIITLHQNFSNYGKNLSSQDKLEWEKVKGRFSDLLFNEPVEQLIYFASKKLKEFKVQAHLKDRFYKLIDLIKDSKLVSYNTKINEDLNHDLYPLDWLSVHILVNSLQRYGQNERSLFSFLNDNGKFSIQNHNEPFYTVHNVFDYLVDKLSTEINSADNPHKPQWNSTFRALERAELVFEENYILATQVIKTIGLVNIFSKIGGLLDEKFIIDYFKYSNEVDVTAVLSKLEEAGITRFYKYSRKINFLEGTDLDLEQELIAASKEINPNFSISDEIFSLIDFPIILAKKYSFEKGTARFFEFKVFKSFELLQEAAGPIDGYINLIFEELDISVLKNKSKDELSNIYLLYKSSSKIKNEIFTIKKFDLLIEKHEADINAVKLLNEEKSYHLQQLKELVVKQMFQNNENVWIHNGKSRTIFSKHHLNEWLSSICNEIYSKTPIFINELINREYLSPPINAARKFLVRHILENEALEDIGFEKNRFPPEKAIYISLLKESGIHKMNSNFGYYELSEPIEGSKFEELWKECNTFLSSSISNKRNLNELYTLLSKPPFKLKLGFVQFWIPIFLIAKREDYALFHSEGGFMPFLNEDLFDILHRKPQDFFVKSYDITGLKINLLESYKELVHVESDKDAGTQSTFLSIFGNFLRFHRSLNKYSLTTNKLSYKAINLRAAIAEAKDPEDALFNKFPNALGYEAQSLKDDPVTLGTFTDHIHDAIREIRSAYNELLGRIENNICDSFYCSDEEFYAYKKEIIKKLEGIDTMLLGSNQKVFYNRLISGLDDRSSWIKSVADVALGKSLDELSDAEEPLLMQNIKELSFGLIKAAELQNFNKNTKNGKAFTVQFVGESGVLTMDKIILNGLDVKIKVEALAKIDKLINELDSTLRREVLLELLTKELKIN